MITPREKRELINEREASQPTHDRRGLPICQECEHAEDHEAELNPEVGWFGICLAWTCLIVAAVLDFFSAIGRAVGNLFTSPDLPPDPTPDEDAKRRGMQRNIERRLR